MTNYGYSAKLDAEFHKNDGVYWYEEKFYFCGRKPEQDFPYCKLHIIYAFQPKGQKDEVLEKDDEIEI